MFRCFMDDLHILHNGGHLEENNNIGIISPEELNLNQENQNNDKATFLELEEQDLSSKILITLTFMVIPLSNQHMEFSHPNSFNMLGSAVRKMIQRVKSLTETTTESLHHQWSQVVTEEMSEETSLDHYQTRPKTSPEPYRRIMINMLGILDLPTYYSLLLLGNLGMLYSLPKQAHVQLDEVTPVARTYTS